ncbi:unnamed protein product [Sphagnum troendelagicum]|uniref:Uncharacterized protein n=1 Tax=Sphagnum troendelagicum TaxID=128251 RepID=A0ABP0TIP6_9BRYO
MDVVEEEVCIEGKERDVVWRGPAAASSRVSSSSPPLQRILRLSSTFPSACLTFARRSCFAVAGMQANIAGYSSKLAKDAIPTSQFRGVAEDTIASILFTTNKFRPARTALSHSLSLSRDMLDCVRYYYSSHKIPRALSLSRFSILSTVHKNAFSIGLSGFPGDDKILPAL